MRSLLKISIVLLISTLLVSCFSDPWEKFKKKDDFVGLWKSWAGNFNLKSDGTFYYTITYDNLADDMNVKKKGKGTWNHQITDENVCLCFNMPAKNGDSILLSSSVELDALDILVNMEKSSPYCFDIIDFDDDEMIYIFYHKK